MKGLLGNVFRPIVYKGCKCLRQEINEIIPSSLKRIAVEQFDMNRIGSVVV